MVILLLILLLGNCQHHFQLLISVRMGIILPIHLVRYWWEKLSLGPMYMWNIMGIQSERMLMVMEIGLWFLQINWLSGKINIQFWRLI
ncbi:hypothetical protein DTR30_24260 [Salmonella enterica]|nr:hypothetical protein [Salmonella enterica]EBS2192920.1 hypothetical protein [Salmonella enterica subsp. enterica serovar Thompson]ECU0899277.1 hypothetical protein [Salmonella enterica subsp. enterica serovar Muenchen]PVM53962.1 hypothetical protein C4802_17070 [Salmonella enterica subsp. enterica serovar Rubislaw]EAM3916272.1 hypothetical protein [Salmonella enterica]